MKSFQFNSFDSCSDVFIIAEIGVNHNGSISMAKELIDRAAECGANAVKFQSFFASKLASTNTPKVDYQLRHSSKSQSHYEMLKELELSFSDQHLLKEYCDSNGILFSSTPYDVESAKFLNVNLDIPFFKTASADIVDPFLHNYIASTNKPVIISTGMASLGEIENVLGFYPLSYRDNICLLQCTSNYPCSDSSMNLSVLNSLRNAFHTSVGFSDHSSSLEASIVAVALGAKVIEKHFTLDTDLPGPDHAASITPTQLSFYIQSIRKATTILGSPIKSPQPEELQMASVSRKAIVLSKPVHSGEILTNTSITLQRPASQGISPTYLPEILGKQSVADLPAGHYVQLSDFN